MTGNNQGHVAGHDINRLLDAALAKYAAIEPRAGLEDRILATLRADQRQAPASTWWKWGLAALAVIVVVAIALAFRLPKPSQPIIVKRVPAPSQSLPSAETNSANRQAREANRRRPLRPTQAHKTVPVIATATNPAPKLDQFPSPQPLTEEEKMLLRYIDRDPAKAALLAEARMNALRQDEDERRKLETEDQRTTQ